MAYMPTNWECGESITSERLNKLEEGVADIMSGYVPTEWQCGDVITAERLNKLEQAVAEASEGGSSDFSTAQVTVVNNTAQTLGLDGGISSLAEGYAFVWQGMLKTRVGVQPNSTGTFTALLLSDPEAPSSKDAAYMIPFEGVTITTNGDCIRDGDSHEVMVYGDCTITIS